MATCDVDEVIAPLAGETDSSAQRDAAFSSAVYQLSHHTALQTHSICCCNVTKQGSSWRKFTLCLEGVVCKCVRVTLCVLMRKIFLGIWFVCVCAFCLLHLHFCAYFCNCMWKYKCFGPWWIFMCVLTAALGSYSNSWHVMWHHYARVVYVCVACPCLTTAYTGLSHCVPVPPPLPPISLSLPLIGR